MSRDGSGTADASIMTAVSRDIVGELPDPQVTVLTFFTTDHVLLNAAEHGLSGVG
jgi:hypothetical protein